MKKFFLLLSFVSLCLTAGGFFFAARDLPFVLAFPNYVASSKKAEPHFDYYVRGVMVSPFYNMQSRQFQLVEQGKLNTQIASKQDKNTAQVVSWFYQKSFTYAPNNGEVAFLLARDYAENKNYKEAAHYLMLSYELYPLSKKIAYDRYRLGFGLSDFLDQKVVMPYRQKEYELLQKSS